jgi:hypothetical protein
MKREPGRIRTYHLGMIVMYRLLNISELCDTIEDSLHAFLHVCVYASKQGPELSWWQTAMSISATVQGNEPLQTTQTTETKSFTVFANRMNISCATNSAGSCAKMFTTACARRSLSMLELPIANWCELQNASMCKLRANFTMRWKSDGHSGAFYCEGRITHVGSAVFALTRGMAVHSRGRIQAIGCQVR